MKSRILSYDVFRGALVVAMVAFHLVVNLTSWEFDQRLFHWVPVGFILFLGVVLARFLSGRWKKKLALAGKLLGIFLLGNVPNFVEGRLGMMDVVVGNFSVVSFEILLPMVAVILASVLFDRVKSGRWWIGALMLALLALNYLKVESYNLFFVIYGVLGYFVGREFNLDGALKNRRLFWPVALLLVATFAVIKYIYFLEILVVAQVILLYFLVNWLFKENHFLVLTGRYCLAIYVLHIALINAIDIFVKHY